MDDERWAETCPHPSQLPLFLTNVALVHSSFRLIAERLLLNHALITGENQSDMKRNVRQLSEEDRMAIKFFESPPRTRTGGVGSSSQATSPTLPTPWDRLESLSLRHTCSIRCSRSFPASPRGKCCTRAFTVSETGSPPTVVSSIRFLSSRSDFPDALFLSLQVSNTFASPGRLPPSAAQTARTWTTPPSSAASASFPVPEFLVSPCSASKRATHGRRIPSSACAYSAASHPQRLCASSSSPRGTSAEC